MFPPPPPPNAGTLPSHPPFAPNLVPNSHPESTTGTNVNTTTMTTNAGTSHTPASAVVTDPRNRSSRSRSPSPTMTRSVPASPRSVPSTPTRRALPRPPPRSLPRPPHRRVGSHDATTTATPSRHTTTATTSTTTTTTTPSGLYTPRRFKLPPTSHTRRETSSPYVTPTHTPQSSPFRRPRVSHAMEETDAVTNPSTDPWGTTGAPLADVAEPPLVPPLLPTTSNAATFTTTKTTVPEATTPTPTLTVPSSSLPPQWTEAVDVDTGKFYFVHVETKETRWERPTIDDGDTPTHQQQHHIACVSAEARTAVPNAAPVDQASDPIEPGWTATVDPASGRTYYYHAATGETRWEPPLARADEPTNPVSKPPSTTESAANVSDIPISLPSGWVEQTDPSSGRPYYYHNASNLTQWERPGDATLPVDEKDETTSERVVESLNPPTKPSPVTVESASVAEEPREFDRVHSEPADTEPTRDRETAVAEQPTEEQKTDPAETQTAYFLPAGWVAANDPSSGRTYYYNAESGVTTWNPPKTPGTVPEREVADETGTEHPEEKSLDPVSAYEETKSESPATETLGISTDDTISDRHGIEEEFDSVSPDSWTLRDGNGANDTVTDVTEGQSPELPNGWQELVDPSSGSIYYYNEVNGTTSWDRPLAQETTEVSVSPPEEEKHDSADIHHPRASPEDTGSANDGAMTTDPQSEPPSAPLEANVGGVLSSVPEVEAEANEGMLEEKTAALPEGWVELVHESSGKTYYFHAEDNVTSWEQPEPTRRQKNDEDERIVVPEESLYPEIPSNSDLAPEETNVAALPQGWIEAVDPSTEATYYINEVEGITSWERPRFGDTVSFINLVTENDVPEPHSNSAEGSNKAHDENDSGLEDENSLTDLPPGWAKLTHPDSGDAYYYNEATNATSWDIPESSTVNGTSAQLDEPFETTTEAFSSGGGASPRSVDGSSEYPREEANLGGDSKNLKSHVSLAGMVESENSKPFEMPEDAISTGWEALVDEASGAIYYYNKLDGTSSWERPLASDIGLDGGLIEVQEKETDIDSTVEANRMDNVTVQSLPEGWIEVMDPNSGSVYYFNEVDGTSSWDKPQEPTTDPKHLPDEETEAIVGRAAHSIATFGFGGKLCVHRVALGSACVAIYRPYTLLPMESVVRVEERKRKASIFGPLSTSSEKSMATYLQLLSKEEKGDILWKVISIAYNHGGKLRGNDSPEKTASPEEEVVELLLQAGDIFECPITSNAPGRNVDEIQSFLLRGQRSDALKAALTGGYFSLALLVASMCERESFQHVATEFTKSSFTADSPMHTVCLLLAGNIDGLLDDHKNEDVELWAGDPEKLRFTWKGHLAAILSNRTSGWDRLAISLGDKLLEIDEIEGAHCCYLVSGCPIASPVRNARLTLLGCNFGPADLTLMTEKSVFGFEYTEAFEWSKRRQNPSSSIQSLQAFKLMYATLLADLGYQTSARHYLQDVLKCVDALPEDAGIESRPGPFSLSILSADRGGLLYHLNSFERRLTLKEVARGTPVPDVMKDKHSSRASFEDQGELSFLTTQSNMLETTTGSTIVGEALLPADEDDDAPAVGSETYESVTSESDDPIVVGPEVLPVEPSETFLESSESAVYILPPGWVESIDSTSGEAFYFNESEGTSCWEKPNFDETKTEQEASMKNFNQGINNTDDVDNEEATEQLDGLYEGGHMDNTAVPNLPVGWVQVEDINGGPSYFYNEDDDVTTWDRPTLVAQEGEMGTRSIAPEREAMPSTKDVIQASHCTNLPEGWEELVEPSSGDVYYYNAAENVTTWDRPVQVPDKADRTSAVSTCISQTSSSPDLRGGSSLKQSAMEFSGEFTENRPLSVDSKPPLLTEPVLKETINDSKGLTGSGGKTPASSFAAQDINTTQQPSFAATPLRQKSPGSTNVTPVRVDKAPTAPSSAPANLEHGSNKKRGSFFNFGIQKRVAKWMNPDATLADPGEEMKAYFDEQRKVWVFPGEDPDKKASPLAPPPTLSATQRPVLEPESRPAFQPNDPLAAMMAPPRRGPSASKSRSMGAAPGSFAGGPPIVFPGSAPNGNASGAPPQFAVFQPKPAP